MRLHGSLAFFVFAGLALAQAPSVPDGGVVNAASFQTPIAGGSLVSIFGSKLASSLSQADSIPLSKSLGGVTVQFINGDTAFEAPLLFVAPDPSSQINCQVPWNLVPNGGSATVNLVVTRDGVASTPTPVKVGPFSPGIFSSGGRAIAVNLDGTLVWPAGVVAGLNTHGAKAGDVIIVYATGLGAVDSPIDDGAASLDKLRNTLTKPTVTIGGTTATVLFSGLAPQFVGVNQLNIQIPAMAPNDNAPMQIQMPGISSPASGTGSATISVIR
jgi:uncharacterized protein (TIGR03437 family)